jgi:tRNA wybutosine-synthesizing protein 2
MSNTPFQEIKKSLSGEIPSDLLELIPEKWEKLGHVLIYVLSPKLNQFKQIISEKYAEILDCKTVLN